MGKSVNYLFFRFLKIGATSWGGYMSLIAIIQKQFTEIDKTLKHEKIVHAISLASILPGPVAVNVVAYIGYQIKGIKGALISMIAVLIPCFILIVGLSYIYFEYGNIPSFNKFFTGVAPAVAAVIISVAFTMFQKNIKDIFQIIIAIAGLLAILFIHSAYTSIGIILISGITGYIIYKKRVFTTANKPSPHISLSKKNLLKISIVAFVLLACVLLYPLIKQTPAIHLYQQILITFSGLSISQFGGGYVVVPAMQKVIVDSLHWLNLQQFTDAIAMGQITPGPIYISAAFIGYKLTGITGAIVATIAMFLPAACIMLLCTKFLDTIITSSVIQASFKGITAAVTGMIAAAGINIIFKTSDLSAGVIIIFIITLILSIKYKLNPVYIIPVAGIAGLFIF